jgi:hypothetical protein
MYREQCLSAKWQRFISAVKLGIAESPRQKHHENIPRGKKNYPVMTTFLTLISTASNHS